MNQSDRNIINRLYNDHLKSQLPGQISTALTATKIDDKTETENWGIAVLDTFLGACGVGVATGDPKVTVSSITLQNPNNVTAGDLTTYADSANVDLTIMVGSFELSGNFDFSQDCFSILPNAINKHCATTSATSLAAEASGVPEPDLTFLRSFRDKLEAMPNGSLGKEWVTVYNNNQDCLAHLLENDDDVKKAFKTQQAIELLDQAIRMVQGADVKLDQTMVLNSLRQLYDALMLPASTTLKNALLYTKNEVEKYVPLWHGLSLAEIEQKLTEKCTDEPPGDVCKPPDRSALAAADSSDWSFSGTRHARGTFTDDVNEFSISIAGKLDVNSIPPVFSMRPSNGNRGCTGTVGKISTDVQVQGIKTGSQAIGALLAKLIGKWFGPGETKSQLLDYIEGQAFADSISQMFNNTIKQYWS